MIFTKARGNTFHHFWQQLQLNVSTTATLGTEECSRYREVANVEWFKQESMYGMSNKKKSPLVEVRLF